MTMTPQDRLSAATRLINVVTGDKYGDGMTVTDIGIGYAEPGYHDNDTVWVFGDWNDRSRYGDWVYGDGKPRYDTNTRVVTSTAPGRLFDALERLGVQGEWSDEWYRCDNCYRAVRSQGDSYMWQPYYSFGDGEITCGDCLNTMGANALDEYVNDSDRAVTWCDESHLVSLGWTRYNPRQFESGWHPGQDDKPSTVAEQITDTMPDYDYLFYLDESSQFYVGFSAFTKPQTEL